ncbi:HVA22-like protein a [Zingiber officinale]|uniref:HVA22-like protein a n=1 Tax=Zingiber officinale TaxID=94328 RepID=UPI001C4A9A87|nr:HVA22-like protein a [Zingiber officinale]
MGSGALLSFIARNFDVLAGPLVTLVYPLYASVKAIESKSPEDDQQWLTYWVLYSLVTLFELTFSTLIEWLPFWPYAKLIFNCWLVLPYFSGATFIYENFVRPMVLNQQTLNLWSLSSKSGAFGKPDDVLLAAEKFIEQNGTEAFEKLIRKAGGLSNPKKNMHATFHDDRDDREESESWKMNRFAGESSSWTNNSFMIFDDDANRRWN